VNSKKNKHSCLKIKIVNLVVALALLLSNCAVPFETADTQEMGKAESIIGYTAPLNITARTNFGVTGYTDLGIGLDMGAHLSSDPVFCLYGTGKQKILTFGKDPHYNLFISGAYGIVSTELNPEKIPYYHYTLLLGIEDNDVGLSLGIGILQDPRYSWELMHEDFSKENYIQILMGIEIGKFLFQTQIVYGKDSNGYTDEFLSFGLGIKL
jgi:hypothetical protein